MSVCCGCSPSGICGRVQCNHCSCDKKDSTKKCCRNKDADALCRNVGKCNKKIPLSVRQELHKEVYGYEDCGGCDEILQMFDLRGHEEA